MNENRNIENGVWGQVMRLNPPVKKKATEEIRGWNSKPAFNKRSKETISFVSLNGRVCPKAERHLIVSWD